MQKKRYKNAMAVIELKELHLEFERIKKNFEDIANRSRIVREETETLFKDCTFAEANRHYSEKVEKMAYECSKASKAFIEYTMDYINALQWFLEQEENPNSSGLSAEVIL